MKIILNNLELKSISKPQEYDFIKELLKQNKNLIDSDIKKLNIEDIYLIKNKEEYLVYLSISSPIVTDSGLNQINLSYRITKDYQDKNYEEIIMKEISNLLLEDNDTMLVFNARRDDKKAQEAATKAKYTLEYTDETNMFYTKYAKKLERHM